MGYRLRLLYLARARIPVAMKTSALVLLSALSIANLSTAQTVGDMIGSDFIVMPDGERIDVVIHEIKNTERSPKKWEKAIYYSRLDSPDDIDTVFRDDVIEFQEYELWKAPWPVDEHGNIRFSEVVQTPGISADQLFLSARTWFVDYFNSAEAVIQMEDKEGGKIMGKGVAKVHSTRRAEFGFKVPWNGFLEYTITLQFRDGRFKYDIDNLAWRMDGYTIGSGAYSQYVASKTFPIDPRLTVEDYYDKKGRLDEGAVQLKEETIRHIWDMTNALKRMIVRDIIESGDDW